MACNKKVTVHSILWGNSIYRACKWCRAQAQFAPELGQKRFIALSLETERGAIKGERLVGCSVCEKSMSLHTETKWLFSGNMS